MIIKKNEKKDKKTIIFVLKYVKISIKFRIFRKIMAIYISSNYLRHVSEFIYHYT